MTANVNQVIDFDARQNALDISCSIAVQAPAGSGKTELLSLRFLKLLAACNHPEEVLAITFTKKAANEMAERILSTLDWAQRINSEEIITQLDKDRFEIAQSVLIQDKKEGWQLQQSPNRLRIQTIDSFCNFLASRLPILSNFGGPLSIAEQIDDCYQLAIRNCLGLLDSELPISESIAKLMLHFDNDTNKLDTLLSSLLRQREQWIGDIVGVASSPQQALDYLTESLLELAQESLADVVRLLRPHAEELLPLLDFATNNLEKAGADSNLLLCTGIDALPDSEPTQLPTWLAICELLLTKDRSKIAFRKTVDVNAGFPAPASNKALKELLSEKKQAMVALLKSMAESSELLQALDYLRRLPMPDEDTDSWEFLNTLTAVLPTLMAQLELAFAQKKKVDYPQVSLAALRALGSEDSPTDLALSLDYQIKHILVDEFQDTSSSQMDLLQKLTAGWEHEDGRTLFVVGDAMQSCYGFRNANVGLFIKLRESGLGSIPIEKIDLLANFRSDMGVVDWVNGIFVNAFPAQNDISRGAVSYSASHAVHQPDIEPAVSGRFYQFADESKMEAELEEASFIAEEITRLRKQYPERKIAILVRSRSHLEHVLPALREAEVPWLATEIDRLDALPIITDLISLTSSICNEADRLSWLAILRAPWCGLSLQDLHAVAIWDDDISVIASLRQIAADSENTALSADGLMRARKIVRVMDAALTAKQYTRISRVVRTTFNKLAGRRVIRTSAEYESVERYFEIVLDAEVAGSIENFSDFRNAVSRSFVSPPARVESNPVQIMTIHKSKGLEFHHVFLPGLSRRSRGDEKSLLLWHQRLNDAGENKLFLATLSATGSEENSLYNLLRFEKAEKSRLESARLLYIGITRAMKSVYLSATLADKEGEAAPPSSRSLLATIWESLQQHAQYSRDISYIPIHSMAIATQTQNPLRVAPSLYRLPSSEFECTKSNEAAIDAIDDASHTEPLELVTENQLQIEIGNLVHESLENYVTNRRSMDSTRIAGLREYWKRRLQLFSFQPREIDTAVTEIESSLKNTMENEELDWIFDNALRQSAAELAMQDHSSGFLQTHVLDRTFIDKDGLRWIIDYKSSAPLVGQARQDFLDEQAALYTAQLERYRGLFANEDNRGIRTALLFTSLGILHECA